MLLFLGIIIDSMFALAAYTCKMKDFITVYGSVHVFTL